MFFPSLADAEIGGRSGTTLEGEAGMNDPAGIALMIGMIELATTDHATLLVVGREFAVEMAMGAAFGLIGARLIVPMLARAHLPSEGLYPGPRACARVRALWRRVCRAPAGGSSRSFLLAWRWATRGCPTSQRSSASKRPSRAWPNSLSSSPSV